jgi:hypothetical protein
MLALLRGNQRGIQVEQASITTVIIGIIYR